MSDFCQGHEGFESYNPLRLVFLQELLNHLPTTVFRAKGFLYTTEKPADRLLLQMVGRRAVISVNRQWQSERPQTRLVFIARSGTCDFPVIERALNNCQGEQNEQS